MKPYPILMILGAIALSGCASQSLASSPSSGTIPLSQATSQAPPVATQAPPPPAPLHVRVHFIVTGTGAPSITYGSDSINRSPHGGLGILGDGVQLPWRGVLRYQRSAQYYDISAQLETGGFIHCKIVITANGKVPLTVARGEAQGSSNICDVQATANNGNGLSWQKE